MGNFSRRRISRTFILSDIIIFLLFEVPNWFSIPFFSGNSDASEQGQRRLQYFHLTDTKHILRLPPVKSPANTLRRDILALAIPDIIPLPIPSSPTVWQANLSHSNLAGC